MTETQSKWDDSLFLASYMLGRVAAHDAAQRETLAAALRAEVWVLGVPYQTAKRTIHDGLESGATIARKDG